MPSLHAFLTDLRKLLLAQGVLEPTDVGCRLTRDYTFNSPSTAAGVLPGRSANGRVDWKNAMGGTFKEIQEAEAGMP